MELEKVKALKKIVDNICDINVDHFSRERRYVNGRAICYKILRDTEAMSYQFIGRQFQKNHATVMHSLKDFRYLLLSDKQMDRDYNKALAIWTDESGEYRELTPLEIKKELKDLVEQNKLLNLSIINVQEECDDRLKEMDSRLQKLLNKCQE